MNYRYGQENLRIPIPEKEGNEMFAIVNHVLGGSRMNVQSAVNLDLQGFLVE